MLCEVENLCLPFHVVLHGSGGSDDDMSSLFLHDNVIVLIFGLWSISIISKTEDWKAAFNI